MADTPRLGEESPEQLPIEIPGVVDETAIEAADSAESGQGLVEYGLIIFLVAIVVIAVLLLVGPRIGSVFSRITQLG